MVSRSTHSISMHNAEHQFLLFSIPVSGLRHTPLGKDISASLKEYNTTDLMACNFVLKDLDLRAEASLRFFKVALHERLSPTKFGGRAESTHSGCSSKFCSLFLFE